VKQVSNVNVTPPSSTSSSSSKRNIMGKPSIEEVKTYCKERNNGVDPQAWMDHYESNGWKVGKNPMKDWRASIRTWERNTKNIAPPLKAHAEIVFVNCPRCKKEVQNADIDGGGCIYCADVPGMKELSKIYRPRGMP
jgi:endogenous inhibitor of DNA gyrase (YacG/DUF329 family)